MIVDQKEKALADVHGERVDHPAEAVTFERYRKGIVLAMLAALAGLAAAAIWGHDWFIEQFHRIGWFQTAMVMLSEAIALFWFVRFLIVHGLLAHSLTVKRVARGARWSTWMTLFISMAVGAAIDAGTSWNFWRTTEQRYERAERMEGTIVSLGAKKKTSPAGGMATFYDVIAEYDFAGRKRRLDVRLEDNPTIRKERIENGIKPLWDYQPDLLDKLREGKTPMPVRMRVNPDRPAEAWIELGPVGQPAMDFAALSVCFAFLQIVMSLGMGAFLGRTFRFGRRDVLPWWMEPASFLPFAIECLILSLAAFV